MPLSLKNLLLITNNYQNILGDLNISKEMIVKAKECGADCVKFQKSCLEEKFTQNALKRHYNSENSFGSTYGKHKAHYIRTVSSYALSFYRSQSVLGWSNCFGPDQKLNCVYCRYKKNCASNLGVSPSLVSRWREGYSFWSS